MARPVVVKVNEMSRPLDGNDPGWFGQQVDRRRRAGESVCVQVSVDTPGLTLRLRTPSCGGPGGAGADFTRAQQCLIDLWIKHGLNNLDFPGQGLVGFLQELPRCL